MKTEELEILLDGGNETQTLDFKRSCAWGAVTFAKDILAMSNVQQGGTIVVGVIEESDGSYTRQGILAEHKSTYTTDMIMDHMASFADPHVSVSVKFPKDKNGTEYVAIIVEPFREVPVICKKNSSDTHAGEIYYRNRDGRPNSARVSNSYDMRDIIDRAVVKSTQRAEDIGFITRAKTKSEEQVKKALEEKLKKEAGDL